MKVKVRASHLFSAMAVIQLTDENKRLRDLLRRSSDWFKANYSYISDDEEIMKLWEDIDNELDNKELGVLEDETPYIICPYCENIKAVDHTADCELVEELAA